MSGVLIRRAHGGDSQALWAILEPVIRAGETYALPVGMSEAAALAYWLGADRRSYVAERAGVVVGTYYIRPNQRGGGAHVANAGFMTAPGARGGGVGRMMAVDALARARAAGYRAMQFNFVIAANVHAVSLWEALGFTVVGRLPGAFVPPHGEAGDALVMFREL